MADDIVMTDSTSVHKDPLFLLDADDVVLPFTDEHVRKRSSSVLSIESVEGPKASSSSTVLDIQASDRKEPPSSTKKRRISPASGFRPTYIGEFVIPNAWSNVSGKGYVKLGDKIRIERDRPEDKATVASTSKGGKPKELKQMNLFSMMKPSQAPKQTSSKNKKEDTIVRLLNTQGAGARYP